MNAFDVDTTVPNGTSNNPSAPDPLRFSPYDLVLPSVGTFFTAGIGSRKAYNDARQAVQAFFDERLTPYMTAAQAFYNGHFDALDAVRQTYVKEINRMHEVHAQEIAAIKAELDRKRMAATRDLSEIELIALLTNTLTRMFRLEFIPLASRTPDPESNGNLTLELTSRSNGAVFGMDLSMNKLTGTYDGEHKIDVFFDKRVGLYAASVDQLWGWYNRVTTHPKSDRFPTVTASVATTTVDPDRNAWTGLRFDMMKEKFDLRNDPRFHRNLGHIALGNAGKIDFGGLLDGGPAPDMNSAFPSLGDFLAKARKSVPFDLNGVRMGTLDLTGGYDGIRRQLLDFGLSETDADSIAPSIVAASEM